MTPKESNHLLWFDRAAERFEESLVVGNGPLGLSDYGDGRFLINEESLWTGSPKVTKSVDEADRKEAREALTKVREDILSGDFEAAEDLMAKSLLGPWKETYLPFGYLKLSLDSHPVISHHRSLNLKEGLVRSRYDDFETETFVSDEMAVMVLCVKGEDSLLSRLSYEIEPALAMTKVLKNETTHYVLGKCPTRIPSYDESHEPIEYDEVKESVRYVFALCESAASGCMTYFMTLVTTYQAYGYLSQESHDDLMARADLILKNAMEEGNKTLLNKRLKRMEGVFESCSFEFPANENSLLPTDQRRLAYRENHEDHALVALYANYGRYLLDQSSRPDSLPANLQGIWNPYLRAPWCSNFTTNINLQMNYWHAEVTGLGAMHESLMNLLVGMNKRSRDYLNLGYDPKGLVIHHNLDLWLDAGPVKGSPSWAYWPMASVWLSFHIFEVLRKRPKASFTFDRLKDLFEVLESVASFIDTWLYKNGDYYITCPSTSPENLYMTSKGYPASVSYASTMDLSLIQGFVGHYGACLKAYDRTSQVYEELTEKADKLPTIKIHQEGYLMEWQEDFTEKDIGHRHLSHLFGFFPDDTYFTRDDLGLEGPGLRALLRRIDDGGDYTSWHCTWVINLLSRFGLASRAGDYLHDMIGSMTCPNLFSSHRLRMDGHELFQIDGNFGGTRAIVEMALQEIAEDLILMPVLPSLVPSGRIQGLVIKGGHQMDLIWDKQLAPKIKVRLTGACQDTLHVNYRGKSYTWQINENEKLAFMIG